MIIGLTGSIATGKSTVGKMFQEEGCYLIDADELVHRLYRNDSPLIGKLTELFSRDILDSDGNIDREKLRKLVLNNREKLKKLEDIVHPEVEKLRNRIIKQIKEHNKDAIIVYEVPLLFEKGLHKSGMFDSIVVVYARPEQEIERLMNQRNMNREEAKRLIFLQMPIDEKIKLADEVIDNSGKLSDTRKQVKKLIEKLKKQK